MPDVDVETRLTALEKAVSQLQQAICARKASGDWLDRVIGSMKDEPGFDEVLAYARAIRESERLSPGPQ